MRGLYLLMFLFAIPLCAALGHDVYMAYGEEMDFSKPLQFSDLGWLWITYDPDGHKWAIQNTDPELWSNWVVPLLEQTALVVALAPIIFLCGIIVLVKLYQLGPWYGAVKTTSITKKVKKGNKDNFGFQDLEDKKSHMKYKRK